MNGRTLTAAWDAPMAVRRAHVGRHRPQRGHVPLLQLLAILALQAGRLTPALVSLTDRLGRRVRGHRDPIDADTRRDMRSALALLVAVVVFWLLLKFLLTELPLIG